MDIEQGKTTVPFQQHERPTAFIDAIERERRRGFGFIPLVGNGLSVKSGIPVMRELEAYLARCVFAAVTHKCADRWSRWNPHEAAWPPFHESWPKLGDTDADLRLYESWIKGVKRKDPPSATEQIRREAYGAAGEWRSALQFLSRLRPPEEGSAADDPPWLDAPDFDIIDSFFLYFTERRRPALGHRMLALLAEMLRFEVILTTNFDELIEQAFADMGNPLTVFEVHRDRALPPYGLLRGRRSIIKVHGGRYGLRADYSIDAPPTREDQDQFVSYLTRQVRQRSRGRADGPRVARNHLLLLGFGGRDHRIREFVQEACRRLPGIEETDPSSGRKTVTGALKVFCVGHSDGTIGQFEDWARGVEGEDRFHAIQSGYPELVMLEAYQWIRGCLPTSHVPFPSPAHLPLPASMPSKERSSSSGASSGGDLADKLERQLKDWIAGKRSPIGNSQEPAGAPQGSTGAPRPIVVVTYPRKSGYTPYATQVFRDFNSRHGCLWLDMDDVASADDLFEQVLRGMSQRNGETDWMPVVLGEDSAALPDDGGKAAPGTRRAASEARKREIQSLAEVADRRWFVFLNARGGAGSNMVVEQSGDCPNGWIDKENPGRYPGDQSDCVDAFIGRLEEMTSSSSGLQPRVCVVLLAMGTGLAVERLKERELADLIEFPVPVGEDERNVMKTAEAAIAWANEESDQAPIRRRFLHALVSLRRVRFKSALVTPAFFGRSGQALAAEEKHKKAEAMIEALLKLRVVDEKTGGFIWILSSVRDEIRNRLDAESEATPEIHAEHAAWYEALFSMSDDPNAVFEAVHHYCEAAYRCGSDRPGLAQAARHLRAAIALIDRSRAQVLRYGFSKGMCRKISALVQAYLNGLEARPAPRLIAAPETIEALIDESLRNADEATKAAAEELRETRLELHLRCQKLKRSIAREVGEHGTAFLRHYETGYLLATGKGVHRKECRDRASRSWADPGGLLAPENGAVANGSIWGLSEERPLEYMHWHRQLGTLFIASRRSVLAARSFRTVYQACGIELEDPSGMLFGSRDGVRAVDWAEGVRLNARWPCLPAGGKAIAPDDAILALIKTLKRHMQALIVKATVAEESGAAGQDVEAPWTSMDEIYACARMLSRRLSPDAGRRWLWEKQIFKTQMTVLHVHGGAKAGSKGSFGIAHRQLNSAYAVLRGLDIQASALPYGIVDLHRADLYLKEGFESGTSEGRTFRQYYEEVIRRASGKNGPIEPPPVSSERFEAALTFFYRAEKALDRAETVLRTKRKNVWWILYYLTLRMRVSEYRLVAHVRRASLSEAETLPILDPREAPLSTRTRIDEYLEDLLRMVRLDLYTLAKVLRSYERCAQVLELYRRWRKKARIGQESSEEGILKRRQEKMAKRLQDGRQILQNRCEERIRPLEHAGLFRWERYDGHEVVDAMLEKAAESLGAAG